MLGDFLRGYPAMAVITLLVVLGLLIVGLIFAVSEIGFINIHREVVQHSQQYTESKVHLLQSLQNDWLELESDIAELSTEEGNGALIAAKEAQQEAIVNQMHTEAGLIPSSEIPADVARFLASHRRGGE